MINSNKVSIVGGAGHVGTPLGLVLSSKGYNVTLIDKNQNKSFKNSLNFIGKYTYVNFESMTNYAGTYPIGVFDKDKKVWLNWYEKNKCKNIKIK